MSINRHGIEKADEHYLLKDRGQPFAIAQCQALTKVVIAERLAQQLTQKLVRVHER